MKRFLASISSVFLAVGFLMMLSKSSPAAAAPSDCIYTYKTVTIQCISVATGAEVANGASVSYDVGKDGFHCTISAMDSVDPGSPPAISNWTISLAASPLNRFGLANINASGSTYTADVVPTPKPVCTSNESTSFTLTATPKNANECILGASYTANVQCATTPPPKPPPEPPPITPPTPPVTPPYQPPVNPPTSIIAKLVTPAGSSVIGAVSAVAISSMASVAGAASNFLLNGLPALGFLFGRRKKKKTGRIIEEGTGMPIVGAVVELLAIKEGVDKKIVSQKVIAKTKTDNYGEYIFTAAPGLYKLEVHKPPYYISDNASASREEYEPNQILKIDNYEEGLVAPNIILTMSQGEMSKKTHSLNLLKFVERALFVLSYAFMVFGTIVAINSIVYHYNTVNMVIGLVYVLLWGYILYNSRRLKANSPWGEVYDGQNRKPLPLAMVRIMNPDGKRLIRTVISDEDGKFSATVGTADYKLIASKPGYVMKDKIEINAKDRQNKFINKKLWMQRGFIQADLKSQ